MAWKYLSVGVEELHCELILEGTGNGTWNGGMIWVGL